MAAGRGPGRCRPTKNICSLYHGFRILCESVRVLPPQSPAFTDIEAGGASAHGREVPPSVPAAAAAASASSRIGRSLLLWLQLRYAAMFARRQKGAATNGGRPAAPPNGAAPRGGGGARQGGAGGPALLLERHSSSSDAPSESGEADIDVEASGGRAGTGCCGGGTALCATLGAELQMEGELVRLTAGMLLSLCDTGLDIAVVAVGGSREWACLQGRWACLLGMILLSSRWVCQEIDGLMVPPPVIICYNLSTGHTLNLSTGRISDLTCWLPNLVGPSYRTTSTKAKILTSTVCFPPPPSLCRCSGQQA